MSDPAAAAVVTVFQQEWGRIVATLIRTTGDWDLAEDCVQDAAVRALDRWPTDGVPDNPAAWLLVVVSWRASWAATPPSSIPSKFARPCWKA